MEILKGSTNIMSKRSWRRLAWGCILTVIPSSLFAVDGVVLIDQSHALAGNITPGDAPGFPVTISQSGSYRLSGNLIVPDANTTAILITADFVTLYERVQHYGSRNLHRHLSDDPDEVLLDRHGNRRASRLCK